ncbi:hypothetical protein PR002_g24206 [Phytophthora rubi]|uniref:Uncharacterized protein n=1 Tax=Phytophthora rubi TaxID=129364 RepID=A0A6A3IJ56_9STRA|nr:hypothetical protein PR002_g24206 [Phytophthora rubi]
MISCLAGLVALTRGVACRDSRGSWRPRSSIRRAHVGGVQVADCVLNQIGTQRC